MLDTADAPFTADLFGRPTPGPRHDAKLSGEFLYPPVSLLDARSGWWRERKAAWLRLGIESEVGRDGNLVYNTTQMSQFDHYRVREGERESTAAAGTSVFDPVLCECAYRWFCPPGGLVLDPFAGGSVRGVVAGRLGYRYRGIDLSERQVAANRVQAETILATLPPDVVTISAAQMRQRFNGCEPDYIRDVCHGACCRSTTHPDGILVTIHREEKALVEARGGVVVDGFLRPVDRRCPFQDGANLCGLHGTGDKPFGCVASPFTLSPTGNRLIVRNRYRLLKCYEDGRRLPAYAAFRASLDRILGLDVAARVVAHLEAGGGDLDVPIGAAEWSTLRDNDAAKGGDGAGGGSLPSWRVGDARNMAAYPGELSDLLFTCPPYGDLERYSDDARDLSTMTWSQFVGGYGAAIRCAADRLAADRFAVFVVGNFRAPDGGYRDLVGETVRACEAAGLRYYNEAVLATPMGTVPARAGKQFRATRKLGKAHQNVLIFVKGDAKKAAAAVAGEKIPAEEST